MGLFINGVRASPPQPLPESFQGKLLYPTFNYRNVTLQVNYGPVPRVALPFSCRMLADAASEDVEIATVPDPARQQYDVVLPVGLPDTGFFDAVDMFLESNP